MVIVALPIAARAIVALRLWGVARSAIPIGQAAGIGGTGISRFLGGNLMSKVLTVISIIFVNP